MSLSDLGATPTWRPFPHAQSPPSSRVVETLHLHLILFCFSDTVLKKGMGPDQPQRGLEQWPTLPRRKLLVLCVHGSPPLPIQFFTQALTGQAVSKFSESREPIMSWMCERPGISACLPWGVAWYVLGLAIH